MIAPKTKPGMDDPVASSINAQGRNRQVRGEIDKKPSADPTTIVVSMATANSTRLLRIGSRMMSVTGVPATSPRSPRNTA